MRNGTLASLVALACVLGLAGWAMANPECCPAPAAPPAGSVMSDAAQPAPVVAAPTPPSEQGPATRPVMPRGMGGALPPGHPPLGGPMTRPAMPPGMGGKMPPGHPPMGGGLPPGHPPMGMGRPTTQPSPQPFTATLIIQARQGTAGAPAPANDEVVIEIFSRADIQTVTAKLDATGTAKVEKLALKGPSQPRVTVKHNGGSYVAIGQLLHAGAAEQTIEITVFQTTSEPVAWTIPMRHMILEPTDQGLRVMELVVIQNPTDKAYLGPADDKGQRTSISLEIPREAQQLAASGMFESNVSVASPGKLTSTQALAPGMTQVRLGYLVPLKDDQARVDIVAPAPLKALMIFLPDDGSSVESEGLENAGIFERGRSKMRLFKGSDLAAGHKATLVVGKPKPRAQETTIPTENFATTVPGMFMLGLAGAGVLVLLAAIAARRRGVRKAGGQAGPAAPQQVQW